MCYHLSHMKCTKKCETIYKRSKNFHGKYTQHRLRGTPAVHDHANVGVRSQPAATSNQSPCLSRGISGTPFTNDITGGPLGGYANVEPIGWHVHNTHGTTRRVPAHRVWAVDPSQRRWAGWKWRSPSHSLTRLAAPILVIMLGANRVLRSIRVNAFFGSLC